MKPSRTFPDYESGQTPREEEFSWISNPEIDDERALLCASLSEAFREMSRALVGGYLTEAQYTKLLLDMEQKHVTPGGLTLSVSKTIQEWTHFTLRDAETGCICGSFEFEPQTGEFRRLVD